MKEQIEKIQKLKCEAGIQLQKSIDLSDYKQAAYLDGQILAYENVLLILELPNLK